MSLNCENKNCRSADKLAVCTCFSLECASFNGNRPIRYCSQCNGIRHNNRRGGDHVVHAQVPSPWDVDSEMQSYMIEAIISLLKEAQPVSEKMYGEGAEKGMMEDENGEEELLKLEERRLLSRYGVWLMVGLCTPVEDTPEETLGRLLAMLFEWFYSTACLIDDRAGDILEKLKTENIQGWLRKVSETHFDVFVCCMLPYPVQYARVGGHWGNHMTQAESLKEGFKRLLCLVPYDVITVEVWNHIMPHWMEAIRTEIQDNELSEFEVLFSKVFDVDMSPLGFNTGQIYQFISKKLDIESTQAHEMALLWIQILTQLEVFIPLDMLFSMYMSSVTTLRKIKCNQSFQLINEDGKEGIAECDESYSNLPCLVLMLDILLRQIEIQEIPSHGGLDTPEAKDTLNLIRELIRIDWIGVHTCQSKKDKSPNCEPCELGSIWFQLCVSLMEYLCPIMETTVQDVPEEEIDETPDKSTPEEDEKGKQEGVSMKELEEKLRQTELTSETSDAVKASSTEPNIARIVTAFEVCEPESLDTVAMMPTEEVVTAFARAITLTETDVALAKCTVASATLVDENDQKVQKEQEDDTNFWHTSQGKFKFTLEELPSHLQLIYTILKNMNKFEDPDVKFFLLSTLRLMCLHAEALSKAARDHRGFLIWTQENLLIPSLWEVICSEYSQIAQIATSLMLHALTLPSGAFKFCKILEENFHSTDWQVRFAAVEKVTMISRFLESVLIKSCQSVQSSVATAFVYLIRSIDDINVVVSQRALLYLDTIKASSIKLLCGSLETQFDTVIVDRPMILQTIHQLYVKLDSVKFLNWDFFFNRFDALFLEAQISLEKYGDIAYPRDLKNTNMSSEAFIRKLNKAHEALSTVTDNHRSLSASLGTKWPYKRALSAPAGMVVRNDKLAEKEKVYNRQSSAPLLKRKSSRFSGGFHFPNHLFPDGNLKEQKEDEMMFLFLLPKIMDLEDTDKETMHFLSFLLMQFLARPDHAYPTEEKAMAKIQNIVLKHFSALLGYCASERGFFIPPSKLRCSPVFNACISSLPKVLDQNIPIGNQMMATWLALLIYCPSPIRFSHECQNTNYSLWLLEPSVRTSWLMSVLIMLYKYKYSTPPMSKNIQTLINIVLNTLDHQNHTCKNKFDTFILGSAYISQSRELSSVSIDMETGASASNTPPPTSEGQGKLKVCSADPIQPLKYKEKDEQVELKDDICFVLGNNLELSKQARDKYERQQWKGKKFTDHNYSSDVDDIEPELEAIPESPKSESSPGSLMGSFTDLTDLNTHIQVETARIRVERPSISSDEGELVILNPPVEVVDHPTIVVDPTAKVECHMEHQIQAFQRSWASSSTDSYVSDTRPKDIVLLADEEEMCESKEITCAEPMLIGKITSSGAVILQNKMEQPISSNRYQIANPSLAELTEVKVMPGNYASETKTMKDPTIEEVGHSFEHQFKQRSRFEILDPSQLEDTIKTEPAVVKQVEHISSAHNMAGIKVQKFSMKTYEVPSSSYFSKKSPVGESSKPFTIKCPSSRFESIHRIPLQERLLPVGISNTNTDIKCHKNTGSNTMPNLTDAAVQVSGMACSASFYENVSNVPQMTSAIVKHSVNPALQSVSTKDTYTITSDLRFPSQERLLPIGPSPKSRGSPSTPTKKWKLSVLDIDISEASDHKTKDTFTVESQIVYPPKEMRATIKNVDKEIAEHDATKMSNKEDGNRFIKADAKIYQGPVKTEPKFSLGTKGKVFNTSKSTEYDVIEPHHYFLQEPQEPKQVSQENFTRCLQSALEELHQTQDTSDEEAGHFDSENEEELAYAVANVTSYEAISHNSRDTTNVRSEDHKIKHGIDISDRRHDQVIRNYIQNTAQDDDDQFEPSRAKKLDSEAMNPSANIIKVGDLPNHRLKGGMKTTQNEIKPISINMQSLNEMEILDEGQHHVIREPNVSKNPGVLCQAQQINLNTSVINLDSKAINVEPQFETAVVMKALPGDFLQSEWQPAEETAEQENLESSPDEAPCDDLPSKNIYKQRKQRKTGINALETQKSIESRKLQKQAENAAKVYSQVVGSGAGGGPSKRSSTTQISGSLKSEDIVTERCMDCGCNLEQYSDEELGLCIVILGAFINREPGLAAPLLPDILKTVAKIASSTSYPWQSEGNIHLPGGSSSSAKQFIRCALHQLAPNGIFPQIFQTNFEDPQFFKTIASALSDFNELNQMAPLQLLLDNLNQGKMIPPRKLQLVMENVAEYLEHTPLESCGSIWNVLLPQFDTFFRKLTLSVPQGIEITDFLRVVTTLLKVSAINNCKSILGPFSKLLSHAIQNCPIKFQYLLDICHLCNRTFNRERDKLLLTRTVIFELVQALKFKTAIPDHNLLMLVQFVLQDAGGSLCQSVITGEMLASQNNVSNMINTNASECMRANLTDALDFVADVHTLSKLQTNFHRTAVSLNEETLGGQLKAGIAQYIALDITKGNSRDNRALSRYLPWLFNPPLSLQQGPKEFTDCVAHIRLLSWLLLGALMHSSINSTNSSIQCQPISLDVNQHIADHIQVILAGFAEQSKASVLHMSSLFHAFILCQLWTMYTEHLAAMNPTSSEQNQAATLTITDFWTKVTPGILQLVSHSKVLAEMVNLHFLSLMEALLECNSTVLAKLLPMWTPVLYSCEGQLQSHLQVRLRACINQRPISPTQEGTAHLNSAFLKWLKKLQFKMGQIELQSSAAIQFYTV